MEWALDKIFGECVDIEECDDKDLVKMGRKISNCFTQAVDVLRDPTRFNNHWINCVASVTWDAVGNKIVPFGMHGGVKTIVFTCEGHGEKGGEIELRGYVLAPVDYHKTFNDDVYYHLGGIVFVGSQICDFVNKEVGEQTRDRALAFEAEFLLAARKRDGSGFVYNDYQKKVLEKYPKGVASLPSDMIYWSEENVESGRNPFRR